MAEGGAHGVDAVYQVGVQLGSGVVSDASSLIFSAACGCVGSLEQHGCTVARRVWSKPEQTPRDSRVYQRRVDCS